MTAAVILALHAVCILCAILLARRSGVRMELVVFIALAMIPGFGGIALLVYQTVRLFSRGGQGEGDIEASRHADAAESLYRQPEEEPQAAAVPLEDALLLGDESTRHNAMMSVLMQPQSVSLPTIRMAQESQDTEVVHYATSAMTEISRQYDLRLQRAETAYRRDPQSPEALDRLVYILKNYLDEGMAQGGLLMIRRDQYQKLLRARILYTHERDDYANLAASCLDSGDLKGADEAIRVLERRFMDWEGTLALRLRYYYMTKDRAGMDALIDEVERRPYRPEAVEEILRFWRRQPRAAKPQTTGL